MATVLLPGLRQGAVTPPASKSHLHRLLIADFLAGDTRRLGDDPADAQDIAATKRCLRALAAAKEVVLDCGESGSTLRFLAPVAAALGKRATFRKAGRLAERPMIEYPELKSGRHALEGNVSSQFVTGLLFALPIVPGDSQIRFLSPLASRGYVDMTLEVIRGAGIVVHEVENGFDIPGGQTYRSQAGVLPEGDWSGAAFWYAANAIGNRIVVNGMSFASKQPDRQIIRALSQITSPTSRAPASSLNVNEFPDSFPILTIAAACTPGTTMFTGIRRLRLKESDRVAAMADVLAKFGVKTETGEGEFVVYGTSRRLHPGAPFTSFGDHRIAMSVAIGATRADGPVEIDDIACAAKSYPTFFEEFNALNRV
ncbi:MAG: 3-phosphoshikimate 1-carboxyvinyltransferase [Kiritimatiellia bacterium]